MQTDLIKPSYARFCVEFQARVEESWGIRTNIDIFNDRHAESVLDITAIIDEKIDREEKLRADIKEFHKRRLEEQCNI